MQAILDQFNNLLRQTWFWVVVALVVMYFLTCATRESFSDREQLEGTLDPQVGDYRAKSRTIVPINP